MPELFQIFCNDAECLSFQHPLFALPQISIVLNSRLSFKMFKRTLLRQAQASRSLLSVRSASTAPLAIPRTSQFQPQVLRPFARFPTARCYSTENKTENGDKQQKENGAETSEAAEDPVTKELEEKRKEVIELKVINSPDF